MHRRQVMITARDDGEADRDARRGADQMQPETKELLLFRGAVTAVVAPAHFPVTPRPCPAAHWQRHRVNDEERARSKQFAERFQDPP